MVWYIPHNNQLYSIEMREPITTSCRSELLKIIREEYLDNMYVRESFYYSVQTIYEIQELCTRYTEAT